MLPLPPPFLPSLPPPALLDGDFPSSILLAALLPPEPDDDDGFQIIVRVTCYICPDRRMYTISIFASILHSQDKNIAEKVLLLLITIIDYWPHGFWLRQGAQGVTMFVCLSVRHKVL